MSKPLLQFVHEYVDRHGHPRRYFRRKGYKKIPLPGVPGSEEYMAAYARALAGAQPAPVGMKRTKTGSLGAAITGYLASGAFVALAPSSQHARRLILEKLARGHGDLPIAGIASRHIVKLLDTKAGKPGAALNLLAALRVLLRYSVAVGLRADDPTVGVRGPKLRDGGHYPWSEDDIARIRATPCARHDGAARPRVVGLYRPAPDGCARARTPARARRADSSSPNQDRQGAGNPHAPGTASRARCDASRQPHVPCESERTPIRGGQFHALVQEKMPGGGRHRGSIATRAAQGRLQASRRGRMLGVGDRLDQRSQEPARGPTLRRKRRPNPSGSARDQGCNANEGGYPRRGSSGYPLEKCNDIKVKIAKT